MDFIFPCTCISTFQRWQPMHLLSASDIDAEEFRFGVHLGPQNFHGICYLLGRCKENTERSEQVGASLLCQVDDECGSVCFVAPRYNSAPHHCRALITGPCITGPISSSRSLGLDTDQHWQVYLIMGTPRCTLRCTPVLCHGVATACHAASGCTPGLRRRFHCSPCLL